jgi:hypothetical protein
MYENLKTRYHFSSWSTRRAETVPVLLRDFAPWREDCLNWTRERQRRLQETESWRLLRMFWGDPEDRDSRVLMEIREAASAPVARECLLDVLAHNQLARLPEGPESVGDVCFVHPEGVPPAVFWVTGNLCLSVLSIGLNPARVLDWGRRLHLRMIDRPPVEARELVLMPEATRMRVNEEQTIRFRPPAVLGEEGYTKFFAVGAELRLEKDGVRIHAVREGEIVVEVLVVEPGRPARAGRVKLSAY